MRAVMSVGQLTNDGLVANSVRFDSQAHNEPAVNTTAATVALSHEIEIDESHRVLNSPAPGGCGCNCRRLVVRQAAARTPPGVRSWHDQALSRRFRRRTGFQERTQAGRQRRDLRL